VTVTAFPGIAGQDTVLARLVRHGQPPRTRAGAFAQIPRGGTPLAGALWYAAADLLARDAFGDFRKLIDYTRASGKTYSDLNGESRAALYLTAARTGLRAGTLAKLRPEDFRLDDPIPHIPTTGGQQKNGRDHKAPLSADLVVELRAWIESRPSGSLMWAGKWHSQGRASRFIRWDLEGAGLPLVTADGSYDFHALRGQCGTDLALAGVPLVVTQKFLGHSTPTLTAKYYVHAGLQDLSDAANQLGQRLGRNSPEQPLILGKRKTKATSRKGRQTTKKTAKSR
jgi:integrase